MNQYSILRFGSTFEFVEMRLRYGPVYEMWWHKKDHGRWLMESFAKNKKIITQDRLAVLSMYFDNDIELTKKKCIDAGCEFDCNLVARR